MAPDGRRWLILAMAISALVVIAAAFWASSDPDGLESVAEGLGFLDRGGEPGYQLLPDYTIPGLDGPGSTIVAGLVGMGLLLLLMIGLGKLLARRSRTTTQP